MKLYNNFIRTFTDLPNHTTLLLHSLSGCPLKCFGCHNYDEIIANTPKEYKTIDELYDYLKKSGFLSIPVCFSADNFVFNHFNRELPHLHHCVQLFDGK